MNKFKRLFLLPGLKATFRTILQPVRQTMVVVLKITILDHRTSKITSDSIYGRWFQFGQNRSKVSFSIVRRETGKE